MSRILIGERIRDRRRALGMSQRQLADALGISTSYLSLIENDRRMIAGRLLQRAAEALDVEFEHLSASRDARLVDELRELANDLGQSQLSGQPATDLASRHPQWARLLIGQYRALIDTRDTALALSDRLNRDPALVELSHQTLTEITSVRSAAEILAHYGELDDDQRTRFVGIIAEASDRLSASARSMIDMLEGPDAPLQSHSPARDVEDFFIDRGNYLAEIEDALPALTESLPSHGLGLSAVLAARLEERHDVRVVRSAEEAPGTAASDDIVLLSPGMPEPSIRFALARKLAAIELAETIDGVVAAAELSAPDARRGLAAALTRYGAGAMLLPYDRFAEASEASRHDLIHLQGQFHASYEQVAHRLVTLRKPGAEGLPFAFVRSDPAGNISKRFSLPGLYMPQFGGACALWALYGAFAAPGRIVAQHAEMSDGRRFVFIAREVRKGRASSFAHEVRYAVMLSCEAAHAGRIVHADALMAAGPAAIAPVGWECRSCSRAECGQRAHPALPSLATPTAADAEHKGEDRQTLPSAQAVK